MEKEGKMLINKEQNQVYMIPNRYTTVSYTHLTLPTIA